LGRTLGRTRGCQKQDQNNQEILQKGFHRNLTSVGWTVLQSGGVDWEDRKTNFVLYSDYNDFAEPHVKMISGCGTLKILYEGGLGKPTSGQQNACMDPLPGRMMGLPGWSVLVIGAVGGRMR
jgi:hypothetical protein